jgi:hypothetical protein
MSDRQFGEKYEDQEKAEKEHEKAEKSWDEKWRRDPLSAAAWAMVLIWAGLVLLADNLGFFANVKWFSAWGMILTGAGLIVLMEVALRLLVPAYRRPVGGSLVWAAILLGIGLRSLVGASIAWPLVLIAIGLGLLVRGLLGNR